MLRKIAGLLLTALAVAAAAPAAKVSDLGWMAGSWVSDTGDARVEEHWTDTRGGVMLGTNRTTKAGKVVGFEFMRIAADQSGAIKFWGSPSGAPPVAFPLISLSDREAIFENPAHDYPTRIVYRIEKGVLAATVSGPKGKNHSSWTFRRPSGR